MSLVELRIGEAILGAARDVYVIAEMSGNHLGDYERAARIVEAAAACGVDAVKLQTYTADTMTIDCDNEYFRISGDGPWAGRNLYDLYEDAHTPWEWQPKLKQLGESLGIEVFSTPFDATAVDFLERELDVNAYKIASFEIVDIPLLEKVATTGKPVILSTGMASDEEIDRALATLRGGGDEQIALLHCISDYPAAPDQMNLSRIAQLAEDYGVVTGLSDHSLSPAVPIAAVALGASIIEKHFTLSRALGGPDASFSLEPDELRSLVIRVRETRTASGPLPGHLSGESALNRVFRKSLFVVANMKQGEVFDKTNLRAIRPGHGMEPKHLFRVLGRRAVCNIERGTPLKSALIEEDEI